MSGLTKRQRELVDFIEAFITANRYSPSYREIGQHFGFSSIASVHKHVCALKKKGALHGESKLGRALAPSTAIARSSHEEIVIPLIGTIADGKAVQMFVQPQQIPVPQAMARSPDKAYALKIEGDFLFEEGIADGDVLVVEVREEIVPGDTVVALINGCHTIVKRYFPEGSQVRLLSSHAMHHPILLRQEDIAVQAVVSGLLRHYPTPRSS